MTERESIIHTFDGLVRHDVLHVQIGLALGFSASCAVGITAWAIHVEGIGQPEFCSVISWLGWLASVWWLRLLLRDHANILHTIRDGVLVLTAPDQTREGEG